MSLIREENYQHAQRVWEEFRIHNLGDYHDLYPPCIMCVQYRGGCSVLWGVFSTVGDIMSTVGGYLEYRGGVQYRGGYHDKCGGIS